VKRIANPTPKRLVSWAACRNAVRRLGSDAGDDASMDPLTH
jgi:hypothetical protein